VHPTASQVKAAYLFNFGKFVRWQVDHAGADSLDICVLGKDPFGGVLDSTVAGESIDGRKIRVQRLAKVQDAARCSILYVSLSEESRMDAILNAVQPFALLTVSDIPHFAEHGGMIEFVVQQGKIRFEVNRTAAEESHVVLSSELLKVASRVINNAALHNQP
jgi:YfiR/HmsC-like